MDAHTSNQRTSRTNWLIPAIILASLLVPLRAGNAYLYTEVWIKHYGETKGSDKCEHYWQDCYSEARYIHPDSPEDVSWAKARASVDYELWGPGWGYTAETWTDSNAVDPCCECYTFAAATPVFEAAQINGDVGQVSASVNLNDLRLVVPEKPDCSSRVGFDIFVDHDLIASGSFTLFGDGGVVGGGFYEEGLFEVYSDGLFWFADYVGPASFEIDLPVGTTFDLRHSAFIESENHGSVVQVPSETTQIMTLSLPEGYAITPSEFVECFEEYDTITPLPDQSAWEPWDDNPDAAEFYATHEQSHDGASALAIDNNDDAVHRFAGYTEDIWEFKAWQYIPEDMNDLQYFILLNTYPASESQHWSMQIECDGAQGLIRDFNGDETLPMVKGQWCEIKVVIDLDEDEQSVYYNGVPLVTKSWSAGVAPGGAVNIAALDLWGNASSSEVYYDDISLTRSEGAPCPGDIDEDGDVDTADLLALLAAWGACP